MPTEDAKDQDRCRCGLDAFYILIQIIESNSMEKLNRLIQDASNQFESHNFHTALGLYVRCVQQCERDQLPVHILYNLKSSQAALRTILGELDPALRVCNEVLSQEKQHWLCLLRRSQIYKKQLKFKKAMKDLDTMTLYAPDNMQVAALKLEIKCLMHKSNGSSSESGSEEDSIDEEELLKFSNLKKIDRTSVSIKLPKNRKSRVTLSGDVTCVYESSEPPQPRQSVQFAPQIIRQKFLEAENELGELDTHESENEAPAPVIKVRPSRGKSILKNRQSELFVSEGSPKKTSIQEGIKLAEKVHNIDGKVIDSVMDEKQVGFRKSLFDENILKALEASEPKKIVKKGSRKSCLKRSSFQVDNEEVQKKGARRSKFQMIPRGSIDGKFIHCDRRRVSAEREASKENFKENDSDEDSDIGSYNIFGSKSFELPQELRDNLGLQEDKITGDEPKKKERGKSILKKNSILVGDKKKVSIFCKKAEEEAKPPERKAKKSVMFK